MGEDWQSRLASRNHINQSKKVNLDRRLKNARIGLRLTILKRTHLQKQEGVRLVKVVFESCHSFWDAIRKYCKDINGSSTKK